LNHTHGTSAKQKMDNLNTAIQQAALVPMRFRDADSDEPHYVRLYLLDAYYDTGHNYEGQYTVQAIKA